MKSILSLFLLSATTVFAQDYITEELVIPFEFHTGSYRNSWVTILGDYDDILELDADYLAELPTARTNSFLSQRTFCKIDGNRFLEFVIYPDRTYFFKEWKDSLRCDLLHYGKVEIDLSNLRTDSIMFMDNNGEDSLVIDSVYSFRKIGPWEFRLPDDSKLYGNYELGNRVGTWTNYLSILFSNSTFLPVLKTIEYEEHRVTTTLVDYSKLDYGIKQELLNGKWKFPLLDAKGVALYKQGYRVLYFVKEEKAKFPCSGKFIGISSKNKLLKWQFNKDNTITIEGKNYTILYLTKDHLLLKGEE